MATAFLNRSANPTYHPEVNTESRTATATLPLGTRAVDGSGNEYLYVRAGAIIATKLAVMASGTEGLEAVVETANTATGAPFLGVAGAAFTDNQYGFIQIRGTAIVAAGNVTAGAAVVPMTTAGTVNDATAATWSSRAAQAVTDDSGGFATIFMA